MNLTGYAGNFLPNVSVAIANGAQESSVIPLGGFSLCGILFRAFTGTAITFEACDTVDGTYVPIKSSTSGTALSYTVAANTYAAIDPKDFEGVLFLKIKSGNAEASARTLLCSLKGI